MGMLKIPKTYMDSSYYSKIKDVNSIEILNYLLGHAVKFYAATVITHGTMISINEIKHYSGDHFKEKDIKNTLNKLIKLGVLDSIPDEDGENIVVNFNEEFLNTIFPDLPQVQFSNKDI